MLTLSNICLCVFTTFILCIQEACLAPLADELKAMKYLRQYGYLEEVQGKSSSLISEDSFKNSIRVFQRFAGINDTGVLDEETSHLMTLPRCGVKDKEGPSTVARRKRYALQGSRWRVRTLSYKISKYPSTAKISKADVDSEMKKAFEVWSDWTGLTFVPMSSGRVQIDLEFAKGEHGDGDPFDGTGGTLAHAFFPMYGGDVHFDDTERWSINSYKGTNLFQVAAHEIGHSLGLSHSDVKASLMAPFYRGYDPSFRLHSDDISGIQALYGEKIIDTTGSKGTSKTNAPPQVPVATDGGTSTGELCADPKIDTIFTTNEGKTFAFKGDNYWEVADEGLADGYPRAIARDWNNLPSNIDGAFTWTNSKTYFFKGDKYWRYTGKSMDPGYPKAISQGFPGIPNNLNDAFVWGGNGKIYFFKGSHYWRFDPAREDPITKDYPKDMTIWDGIPTNLDAVFQWSNGYTYFFKGNQYWRFNDRLLTVDKADPAFPRPSSRWWFGCKTISSNLEKASIVQDPDLNSVRVIDFSSTGSASNNDIVELHQQMGSEHLSHLDTNAATSHTHLSWQLSTLVTSLMLVIAPRLLV